MPLEAYQQYHPSTPEPSSPSLHLDGSGHSRNVSGSSTWSSPDSIVSVASAATRATTPSASPAKPNGQNILPRIRTQDQVLEPDVYAQPFHRLAQSHYHDEQYAAPSYRPDFRRRSTSPPAFSSEAAPISATSTLSPWVDSAAPSPLPFTSSHAQGRFGHGRSISTSSVESTSFRPIGNPFYRSLPVYITHESSQYPPAVVPPTLDDFVSLPLTAPTDPSPSRGLTPEFTFGPGDDLNATTTLSTYLTDPNPSVFTIGESHLGYGDGTPRHFWWDIRNIRPWDDFNLSTISTIPGLSTLLNIDIRAAGLPSPAPPSHAALNPEGLDTLADTIRHSHIAKVNAALLASQGHNHNTVTVTRNKQDGVYFVSRLANERSGNLSSHGRVIGLVKPYERWNSGKRHSEGYPLVEYLQGLAHLQVLMRQHNCRYGYIITEIELVCVRMGTEACTPHFGFLELSRPIAMRTCRRETPQPTAAGGEVSASAAAGGAPMKMTACVALWYLNMLAGNTPLEGQYGWKIDVGPPVAHTRAKVLREGAEGRDEWMPKAHLGETRNAKKIRGWVWPEDPIHRTREGINSSSKRQRRH